MALMTRLAMEQEEQSIVEQAQVQVIDPSTEVSNGLLELQQDSVETQEIVTAVEDGECVDSALTDLASALLPTVQDDGSGVSPTTAKLLETAVEHFKKTIAYTGSKGKLAVENFGGGMSKKQATQLAIEDLQSLSEDIKKQLDTGYVLEFTSEIKRLQSLANVRKLLNDAYTDTSVMANSFYTSDKYKAEFNSSDLVDGEYTKYIVNAKDSEASKMPTTAVINGLNALKQSYSSTAYLPKVNALKSIVQTLSNGEVTTETLTTSINGLQDLYASLINSKEYINQGSDTVSKQVFYPLGGVSITSEYSTSNSWCNHFSTSKEKLESNITLGALSSQESNIVLGVITELVNTQDYTNGLTETIEAMVEYLKKNSEVLTAISNSKNTDLFRTSSYEFRNYVKSCIDMLIKIAVLELTTLNALLSYCKDSVAALSTKEILA
jgi:hypothetical protein